MMKHKISSTLKYLQNKSGQELPNSNGTLGAIYFILIHFFGGRKFRFGVECKSL